MRKSEDPGWVEVEDGWLLPWPESEGTFEKMMRVMFGRLGQEPIEEVLDL